MLNSLFTAVTGLQQFQNGLDVIGNNIANANTVGYKAAKTQFEDSFSQNLQVATGRAGDTVGSMQIGAGVAMGSISNDYTQGTVTSTGVQTDLAINGDGFFMVRDINSSQQYATRAGDFHKDSEGYLVTSAGLRVQGYSDADLTTRGDLQIDGNGRPDTSDPNATVSAFSVGTDGKITVTLSDGSSFVRGQVLLQNFNNPQALLKEGGNLYSNIPAAGPLGGAASAQSEAPGTSGLGFIRAASLERSNVDLTNEFANMITVQRAFQANARVLTTSDEVLQEVVSLKR